GGDRGILANIDGVQKFELSCGNFVGIVQTAASKNFQLTFDACRGVICRKGGVHGGFIVSSPSWGCLKLTVLVFCLRPAQKLRIVQRAIIWVASPMQIIRTGHRGPSFASTEEGFQIRLEFWRLLEP